jgi:Mg-chelatase subunit ChlD
MKRVAPVLSLVLCFSLIAVAQKPQPRTIFIEAMDAAGAPVADLKPADLELTEGGVKRPVTKVTMGNAPMRIAFLVDTGAAASEMTAISRTALNAFLTAYEGTDEMALVAIGRQPRILLKPTNDKAKIKKAFDSIFQDGGATQVMDGVRDTYAQLMKGPEVSWPVFVIVATASNDGTETQPQELNRFEEEIRMKGVTIHAIMVQLNNMGSAMEYARTLAKSTGGSFETITAPSGLPDKLKALAPRLHADHQKMARRYVVEFMGDPKMTGQVEINVMRSGIKIGKMSNVRPF